MAAALRKCMAMGDAEVVECVANLATVRHEDLNRLLSALFRGVMQQLVVATAAARDRVTERLTAGRVSQFRALARLPSSLIHCARQCSTL